MNCYPSLPEAETRNAWPIQCMCNKVLFSLFFLVYLSLEENYKQIFKYLAFINIITTGT